MSRVGDDMPEIEMPSPVDHDPTKGSSSTVEKPEGDSIVNGETPTDSTPKETPRKASQFRGRQIQMMAISLAIGSGLLYDTGGILYLDGPVSLILGYLFVGTVMYAVMITLGEMISLLPVPGGFLTLANRCLTPSLGFAVGWSYWFSLAIAFTAQLVASSSIISLWLPNTPPEAWVFVISVVCFLFNNFRVRRWGEVEYWLTALKVCAIVGIIFAGVLLPMNASPNQRLLGTDLAGNPVPCNQTASNYTCVAAPGFNYWRADAFKMYLTNGKSGRFLGLWNSCCQAIFSYLGVEAIAIAADECERQKKVLPGAVRRISYRVIIYYVGAVFVLGLNLSPDDPSLQLDLASGATSSPFALMFDRAGVPALRNLINACALIASVSSANASLYIGSRTLYALALEGQAPKMFKLKSRFQVSFRALVLTAVPSFLAYVAVGVKNGSWFNFLVSLTVTGEVVSWSLICWTYLRFRSTIGKNRMQRRIPQKARSPLQPFLAVYGLTFSSILLVFQGFQVFSKGNFIWTWTDTDWGYNIAPWIGLLLIIILVYGFQYYSTRRLWEWDFPSWNQIDLFTGLARDEPRPKRRSEAPNGTDGVDSTRYEDEEDQPSLVDRLNKVLDAI